MKAEAEAESLPLLVTAEDGTRTRNSEFVRRMRFNRETILENLDKINAQLRAEGEAFAELRVTALNADGSYEVVIDLFDPGTSAMSLYGAVNTALDLIRSAGGKTATVAPSGYTYEDIVRLSEAQGRQFLAADRLGLLCTELGLEADPAELAAYAEKYGTDYTAFDDAARALLEEKLGTAEVDAEIAARTGNRYTTLAGMTAALLGGDPDEVLAQAAKTEVSRVYPKLDLAEMSLTSLATEIVLGLYCDPEAPLSAERSMYNVLVYVRDHIREIAATLESFAPYCINRITVGAEIAAEEGTLGVAYHFTFCERFGEGA